MEAAENLPVELGNLAAMEALLARSWSARHEDTNLMFRLAFLAVKRAEKLEARQYGTERVYDFRCRAEAELGNAYRVIEQLDAARATLGRARRLFELGTGSELLDVRLLNFEASLDAALWNFDSASVKLTKAYQIYMRLGERHLAGRTLVKKGLFTSYSGEDEKALLILRESESLIDSARDPALAFSAGLNILLILTDLEQLDAAKIQLFTLRRLLPYAGGSINQLRFLWVEARIDSAFGYFERAESNLRKIREAFLEINKGYDAALTSLDLAAVLMAQKKAKEASKVVISSYKSFIALGIQNEAIFTLSFLRTACEVQMATREMIQDVAKFMRELQIDAKTRYKGRVLEK
jgi:tetratricopeptide (TPR) repeat protein